MLLAEDQGRLQCCYPQDTSRWRGTKAAPLQAELAAHVGAVTFLGTPHPACPTAHALGQTDGPLQFPTSFHQLWRDLRCLV